MYWRRLPVMALLLVTLLFYLSPVTSYATSIPGSYVSQGKTRSKDDPDNSDDVVVQSAQDDAYKYFFPLVLSSPLPSFSCDYTIGPEIPVADARTNYSSVRPGDRVCIAAGNRGDLSLRNFRGTPGSPITFVNSGGRVVIDSSTSHGIMVKNSRYFRLTGSGADGLNYGIKIVGSTSAGVDVGFKSTNFEIDHIEVSGVNNAGIHAKTEAVCSDGSANDYDYDADGVTIDDPDDVVNRDSFTQFNFALHDNYVHNVGTEGFYVGSSFYRGRKVNCRGGTETVYAPVINGVSIYNNKVTDTGWDGIQVGSAIQRCDIHHNQIFRDSQANRSNQQGGIMNNPGSVCNIYNNFIKDGGGPGIFVQGNGGNVLANNVIVSAGQNMAVGNNGGDGITIISGSNTGSSIYVLNNTLVRPRNFGVKFHCRKGSDNCIQNNIIVGPGNLDSYGQAAYIQTWRYTNVSVTHNLGRQDLADVKFKDPTRDDYSIQWNSLAVDAGIDPIPGMVTLDYVGRSRPQGAYYDIGAYECEFPPPP